MPFIESTETATSEILLRPSLSKSGGRAAADDPRWLLAQRISNSKSIGRSPLLSDFLLYICDRHIRKKSSGLTEQQIGVRVFGRPEGYNSNDDNIVRNYARTLPKRVEEYFATEGQDEELKLEIPRGAYVPTFYSSTLEEPPQGEELLTLLSSHSQSVETVSPASSLTASLPMEVTADDSSLISGNDSDPSVVARFPLALYPIAALCLLLMIAAYVVTHRSSPSRLSPVTSATQPSSLSDVFWSQLFQKKRDTFVVPADAGLVIMQGLTRNPVSLGEYAGGSYRLGTTATGISSADLQEVAGRRYASIVDLDIVSQILRLKEIVPERMLIRYARDLRMDDLRSSNAILLGSADSNPWAELFQEQLNFRFSYSPKTDASPVILNQHPLAGEKAVYANDHVGSMYNTYGAIAYQSNLDGTGHVLMVGGLTMAGTQAAADFLLNPASMQPILEHARASNGTIRPFEILVETSTIAANASRPQVISERISPL